MHARASLHFASMARRQHRFCGGAKQCDDLGTAQRITLATDLPANGGSATVVDADASTTLRRRHSVVVAESFSRTSLSAVSTLPITEQLRCDHCQGAHYDRITHRFHKPRLLLDSLSQDFRAFLRA
ncbi:MAG: hypothetical protein ACREVM_10730 [Burkholderiales bacterium]